MVTPYHPKLISKRESYIFVVVKVFETLKESAVLQFAVFFAHIVESIEAEGYATTY
jgi:hypothetical protein